MNKILNTILYYIKLLLITIITSSLVIISVFNLTILNKSFNKLIMNNYYNDLYNEVTEEIKNQTISSGIDEVLIKEYITREDIEKDVNKYVDYLFGSSNETLDFTYLNNRIDFRIDKYIQDNNIKKYDKENVISYRNDVIRIYKDKITVSNYLDDFRDYIIKIKKISIIINIVLLILFISIIILLIIKKRLGEYIFIAFDVASILMLFISFLIIYKLDIVDLMFMTTSLSNYIIYIFDMYKIGFIVLGSITLLTSLIVNIIYLNKNINSIKYL